MKKNKNKVIFLIIRIIISLVLFGALFYMMRSKIDEILNIMREVNLALFLVSLTLNLVIYSLSGLRLNLLFKVNNIHFRIIEVIKLVYIGSFFNSFMPTSFGGDVIKMYYAKKRSTGMLKPVASVFIDRVVGMAAMVFLAMITLTAGRKYIKHPAADWIIFGIFSVLMAGMFLCYFDSFAKKLSLCLKHLKFFAFERKLNKIYGMVVLFRSSRYLFLAFVLGIVSWVLLAGATYILSMSMSVELPFYLFLILTPIIAVFGCLPSINGLGVREGAFVFFLKDLIGPERAFALSILFFSQMMIASLIGGFVYLFSGEFKKYNEAVR
ncbi:MAG: lysylphosphatidylglycerol synthase transmembrane domain-containing protein [Candidatus Omnitrophota bacterium]